MSVTFDRESMEHSQRTWMIESSYQGFVPSNWRRKDIDIADGDLSSRYPFRRLAPDAFAATIRNTCAASTASSDWTDDGGTTKADGIPLFSRPPPPA
jgi:hypothetical protein